MFARPLAAHFAGRKATKTILCGCHHSFLSAPVAGYFVLGRRRLSSLAASEVSLSPAIHSKSLTSIASVSLLTTEQHVSETLPASTFSAAHLIEDAAEAFLSLPDTLGGGSFTTILVFFTLFLRLSITVPITVWQRKRVRKVTELVIPEVKAWGEKAKYTLRTEFRRAGKDYEEYTKGLTKQVCNDF